MQHIICTGNIGSPDEYERLRQLVGGSSANVHCVAGEYDTINSSTAGSSSIGNTTTATTGGQLSFPETKIVQLGQFRVGVIGGQQIVPYGDLCALGMMRRKLNVDILVCGQRRKEGVVEHEGGYYIFPVS